MKIRKEETSPTSMPDTHTHTLSLTHAHTNMHTHIHPGLGCGDPTFFLRHTHAHTRTSTHTHTHTLLWIPAPSAVDCADGSFPPKFKKARNLRHRKNQRGKKKEYINRKEKCPSWLMMSTIAAFVAIE